MAAQPPADVSAFLHGLAGPERELAEALREAAPAAVEALKWGQPNYSLGGTLCAISPADGYTRLQFWRGAELRDAAGLLEGTGKRMRHVKVHSVEEARSTPLRELLRAAIALDRA